MATVTGSHYPDTSTFANFKAQAKFVSDAYATFGWVQGNDPGQIVWTSSSVPCSQVVVGASAVYHYDATSATGPVLRIGMSIVITGFATGGNNVTATITALGGSGASSTFTVALTTQANETHAGSGDTTAATSVPSSGSPGFEIWNSADASSSSCPIAIKVEYWGSSNIPGFAWTVGTNGTDGAGNVNVPNSGRLSTGAYQSDPSNLYPCYASGDSGSFRLFLFNNGGASYPDNYQPAGFMVSRDYNASGVIQGNYVQCIYLAGQGASNKTQSRVVYSVANGGGVTPLDIKTFCAALPFASSDSGAYGSNVLVSPCFPFIGALGNPNINHFTSRVFDFGNAAVFTMSVYGTSHTYIVMNQNVAWMGSLTSTFIMRWE